MARKKDTPQKTALREISCGDMEIDVPRDRKGGFEPQIVKKYQNTITQDKEEKSSMRNILSLKPEEYAIL